MRRYEGTGYEGTEEVRRYESVRLEGSARAEAVVRVEDAARITPLPRSLRERGRG